MKPNVKENLRESHPRVCQKHSPQAFQLQKEQIPDIRPKRRSNNKDVSLYLGKYLQRNLVSPADLCLF